MAKPHAETHTTASALVERAAVLGVVSGVRAARCFDAESSPMVETH